MSALGESQSNPQIVDAAENQPPTGAQVAEPNQGDGQLQTRRTSIVWKHFERKNINGKFKAICTYCDKHLVGGRKEDTSHLHEHLKTCPKRKQKDIRQCTLSLSRRIDGRTSLSAYTFDQESSWKALAEMIILHEYPISIVEHHGFREFCSTLQPLFKHVSRYICLCRFIYVPCPHISEALSNALMTCLLDWNMERKLSTLTVNNCTTNDKMIEILFDKLPCNELLLGGDLFHVRCSAHVLNLIVKDGLEVMDPAVEKVRDSVAYWTATPKREEKFLETARLMDIPSSKKLALDCKTRWNSTYLMLHTALIYKDVFWRLKQHEANYKCLPSDEDWLLAREVCERLELFYEVTELCSGTKYPTVNLFFPKICEIRASLSEWEHSSYKSIRAMGTEMISKFESYWSSLHGIMAVGNILDPRFKMKWFEFYFKEMYKRNAKKEIEKVEKFCLSLLKEYQEKEKTAEGRRRGDSSSEAPSETLYTLGKKGRLMSQFELFVSSTSTTQQAKSEFHQYLEEGVLPRADNFDVLPWWKTNGIKYPTLSAIARDILTVPVTTIASESAFSISGRFVSPHRSRLLPKTLEALMCAQNWLWAKKQVLETECGKGMNTDDVDVGNEENEKDSDPGNTSDDC